VCPDEVSALVLDIGTSTLRAGYAGDDTPKAIIPTSYGFVPVSRDADVSMIEADTVAEPAPPKEESKLYLGQHGPSVWREDMQIGNPMNDGLSACGTIFLLNGARLIVSASSKSPALILFHL
jgi:actin-like protein 6B